MSLKPPRLHKGAQVGIISPSWGGAGAYPHRARAGMWQLEQMGYPAKLGQHALNQRGFVSDTPANRASDLHDLFVNPEVGAIVSAIGGDHSCHLLPHLDIGLIRAHPKILCGFSDVTVLNVALWAACGLVTFNGPALLTDFAEYPAMYDYTRESWLRVVASPEPAGSVLPSSFWTEDFQEWGLQVDETARRPRTVLPSPGWTWLKEGIAEGVLIGGCIESLDHLRGTRWWPDWEGAIFFFETSEEKPSPERVDSILMDYDNMGILAQLRGMLVGRPMKYSDAEKQELREVLLERTEAYSFPIITDMDFGHTAPQMTLPIGVRARIDTSRQIFEISEASVKHDLSRI